MRPACRAAEWSEATRGAGAATVRCSRWPRAIARALWLVSARAGRFVSGSRGELRRAYSIPDGLLVRRAVRRHRRDRGGAGAGLSARHLGPHGPRLFPHHARRAAGAARPDAEPAGSGERRRAAAGDAAASAADGASRHRGLRPDAGVSRLRRGGHRAGRGRRPGRSGPQAAGDRGVAVFMVVFSTLVFVVLLGLPLRLWPAL